MIDQADELRMLARRAPFVAPAADTVHWLTLCGGNPGVGVTSCAINLALALAERGLRIWLVDAAPHGTIAGRLKLSGIKSWQDVATGNCSLHEALQPCVAGVQVLAGLTDGHEVTAGTALQFAKLTREVRSMSRHVDVVVCDTGAGPTMLQRECWRAAQQVAVLCTAQSQSMIQAYGLLKLLAGEAPRAKLAALVSQSPDQITAHRVVSKLCESALRFCRLELTAWPGIPTVERIRDCDAHGKHWYDDSDCPAAEAVRLMAELVMQPQAVADVDRPAQQLSRTLAPVWPRSLTA